MISASHEKDPNGLSYCHTKRKIYTRPFWYDTDRQSPYELCRWDVAERRISLSEVPLPPDPPVKKAKDSDLYDPMAATTSPERSPPKHQRYT